MRVVIKAPVSAPVKLPPRNAKCICGSGRKAKRCCLLAYEKKRAAGIAEAQERLDTTGSLSPRPEAGGQPEAYFTPKAGGQPLGNHLRQTELPEVRSSEGEA